MTFNPKENLVFQPSAAYELGSGRIPVDSSSVNELLQVINSSTAPIGATATVPGNYNGLEVIFDTNIGSGARVRFDKSYIKMDGLACTTTGPTAVITPCSSIPWNSIAALFDAAEVQLNQSSSTLEQITQNLGHASMVKMLTRYSRDALEAMDDMFFTPCIEERRDVQSLIGTGVGAGIGLSAVSRTRRSRNLNALGMTAGGAVPAEVPRSISKNIYLSELFDSLRIPAAVPTTNIHIKVRTKLADGILFHDSGAGLTPGGANTGSDLDRFYIRGMTLHLVLENMTEDQLKTETEKLHANETVLRESFYVYDSIAKEYTAGTNFRDSNIKNMQACVVMFPSTLTNELSLVFAAVVRSLGINPYQYCHNAAVEGTLAGISRFQTRYGQFQVPANALNIATGANPAVIADQGLSDMNSELIQLYRNVCNKLISRRDPPAIGTRSMSFVGDTPVFAIATAPQTRAGGNIGYFDLAPYVLFCAPFFPQTTHSHKTMGGDDHEIFLQGSGNVPSTAIITRIRTGYLMMKGDTTVGIFN